jgi:hypothetical protein
MWIQTRLSYLTCCASSQEPLYISPHPWPKEVHVQNFLHHLYTKMSYQTTSMRFPQKQKITGTNWNA